ncbi:MAG: pseudouridine-5'-phosphate glycosidase [Kiloniellaceae bacterium]
MSDYLDIRPQVAAALAAGRSVVALETTLLAHGLPPPHNLEAVRRMDAAVRAAGAVPATIGVLDGKVRVGLDAGEIARFATAKDVAKVSRRDLAAVLAGKACGATTVAASVACAALAGIRVFATGGIGGVHRGGERSLDVSADLSELARSPVAVVCAGAKAILDLPRTLEVLETAGVPVIGYGTDEFPAFFTRRSGLALDARVDTPEEAANLLRAHWGLGPGGGVVIANPPPAEAAPDSDSLERWIEQALATAQAQGVRGKAVTPFVLARLAELSGGRTVAANLALLEANARLAGQIAAACAAPTPG